MNTLFKKLLVVGFAMTAVTIGSAFALSDEEKTVLFRQVSAPAIEKMSNLDDFVQLYNRDNPETIGKLKKAMSAVLKNQFKIDAEFLSNDFFKRYMRMIFGIYVAQALDSLSSWATSSLITIASNSNELFKGEPKRAQAIRASADEILEKLRAEASKNPLFSDITKLHIAIVATSNPLAEKETNAFLGIDQWLSGMLSREEFEEVEIEASPIVGLTPLFLAKFFKNNELAKKIASKITRDERYSPLLRHLLDASKQARPAQPAATVAESYAEKRYSGYGKAMAQVVFKEFGEKISKDLDAQDPGFRERYGLQ